MGVDIKHVNINTCEHWTCDHQSIWAWERGIIKACKHESMWSSKHVSTGVTPASLKFNLIASRMELMNYLIYFEGDIILYYDIYKENK